jgi:hypothetical protein
MTSVSTRSVRHITVPLSLKTGADPGLTDSTLIGYVFVSQALDSISFIVAFNIFSVSLFFNIANTDNTIDAIENTIANV